MHVRSLITPTKDIWVLLFKSVDKFRYRLRGNPMPATMLRMHQCKCVPKTMKPLYYFHRMFCFVFVNLCDDLWIFDGVHVFSARAQKLCLCTENVLYHQFKCGLLFCRVPCVIGIYFEILNMCSLLAQHPSNIITLPHYVYTPNLMK